MVLGRTLCLGLASWLFHRFYLVPVVYDGAEPWGEEVPWLWVITAAQTAVAVLFYCAGRLLRRSRTKG